MCAETNRQTEARTHFRTASAICICVDSRRSRKARHQMIRTSSKVPSKHVDDSPGLEVARRKIRATALMDAGLVMSPSEAVSS